MKRQRSVERFNRSRSQSGYLAGLAIFVLVALVGGFVVANPSDAELAAAHQASVSAPSAMPSGLLVSSPSASPR